MTPPPSHTLSMITIGLAASHLSRRKAWIDRMGGGQQLNVRSYLDIVTDGDLGYIQRDQTPVHEAARSDSGLIAVVAIERWADLAALPERCPTALSRWREVSAPSVRIWTC